MSCRPHEDRWAHRGELERLKQQQRAMWTAAVTGAVTGAMSGARGAGPQVRVGDAERDAAVSALGEHFVAGRITKDELDERSDAAWSARTSGDLARLFTDLPTLQPAPPPPRRRGRRRSWWLGVRLSWLLVGLVVLATLDLVPWFVVLLLVGLWGTGVLGGPHRWGHHVRH